MQLATAVNKYLDSRLNAIPWSKCNIYVTRAFYETVTDGNGVSLNSLSEYMRLPDALVVFPDGAVLLLSEWEADQVLPFMWKLPRSNASSTEPFFANLSYLRQAADNNLPCTEVHMRVPPESAGVAFFTRSVARGREMIRLYSSSSPVSDITLAGLQLLAGETMFATDKRKRSITELATPTSAARKAALQLVRFRGRQNFISRSDLENICNVDIGEAY